MIAGTADQYRIVITGVGLAAPPGTTCESFERAYFRAAVA